MPVFGTLLALVVVVHLTGHVQESGQSPVGLWLAEARSQGGLGGWIEVRADGTASVSFGALVEGTYTMEGTSLRIVIPRGKSKDASTPDPLWMRMPR